MLVAALGFAFTAVATKLLTRTETTLSILFWMNAIQLPLNLVAGRLLRARRRCVRRVQHHGVALAVLCLAASPRTGASPTPTSAATRS